MGLAVLGWGSLIWQPVRPSGALAFDGIWREDGPALPIEFARIAADRRITLVLVPGAKPTCRSLWTTSTLESADAARHNLAVREGMPSPENVHGVMGDGTRVGEPDAAIAAVVSNWLPGDVDGALWTGLPVEPTWVDEDGSLRREAVLAFAETLEGADRRKAHEYVARAPVQTATPLRERLLAALAP